MKIAVIGSGVIGYCTAISLLKQGRDVVIYTKDNSNTNPENKVSIVACALWQPYKLFGNLEFESEDVKNSIKDISRKSLLNFAKILESSEDNSGVYKKMHYEYSTTPIKFEEKLKDDFYYINLLKEFWNSNGIPNAILDEQKLVVKNPILSFEDDNPFKYLHGYLTYIIDSPLFLEYLHNKFIELKGELIIKSINSRNIKSLTEKVIFNCTGINGFKLLNNKNLNLNNQRKIKAKKGVLLLYNLKDNNMFPNTIVMDELTILCRKNQLTIGTGEIKENESSDDLINRLKFYAKNLIENSEYNDYGFKEFLKYHNIDLSKPNKILIGSRPYFSDGKGYFLNHYYHPNKESTKLSFYNNFGHGGSGVTLCWGTASEITDIYLNNVTAKLNSYNSQRIKYAKIKYSIEFGHFDFKEIRNLTNSELLQKIESEYFLLNQQINEMGITRDEYSLKVLIDDKESRNDIESKERLLNCLKSFDIDYLAYETRLVEYLNQLETHLKNGVKKEFDNYHIKHQRIGCSQDIFLWYSIRFGIVEYEPNDKIIVPISEKAIDGTRPFYASSIITVLPKHLKKFEDLADEYIKKTFGFEIASSIKRIYYQRKNER